MSEAGDADEFTPQSTAPMDVTFWGVAHGVGFAVPLVLAWLAPITLAVVAAIVCAGLLIGLVVWWAWEFEDWWDHFKASNRALLLGLPAALITPTLGAIIGASLR